MSRITNNYLDTHVQLSDEQFEALVSDREDGSIVNLHLCYHVMTEGQIEERLTQLDREMVRVYQRSEAI